jgi:ubiquinone/menaquinone biosynthesis C-methylase UbiE
MIYGRYILPSLIGFAMKQKVLTARRAAIIPLARGRVLEIGIGSGLNLPFYSASVTQLDGVDPSRELLRQAEARAKAVSFPVTLHEASAEKLPLEDHCIDAAVMTWTLCSIAEPERAMQEVRRVLKPSGTLLFAEHGLSPEPNVAAWQRRLDPCWNRLAGGCHLNRPIESLIEHAGFDVTNVTTGYLPGPRVMAWGTFMYQGQARAQ